MGMSSLAAGLAIGIVGDAGVRANAQQPRLFVAWRRGEGAWQPKVSEGRGYHEDTMRYPTVKARNTNYKSVIISFKEL